MLNYAKAIGANTDFLTAQAFLFPVEDKENQLLVISISGLSEDGFAKIRKVGLDAKDLFFESDLTISDRFDKICQFIRQELADFEKLDAILSFFDGESLYLQTINSFDTLLLRAGSVINLTIEVESEKLISGLLEVGDRVLFLNPSLTELEQNESRQDLIKNLIKSDTENLEFEVEAFLQQLPKSDPIATVLVEKLEEPEPVLVEQPEPKVEVESAQSQSYPTEDNSPPIFNLNHQPVLSQSLSRSRRLARIRFINPLPLIWGLGLRKLFIFLIILIIAIGLLVSSIQKNLQKDQQFSNSLKQAQQSLDKAVSIKDSDPDGARQALTEAKGSLAKALEVKPKDQEALNLQNNLQNQSYQILKEYQVLDFPVFLDLNLIKPGFTTSRMSYSLGRVGLLDKVSKTLVSLDLEQKLPKILAGSLQLGEVQFASINGDNLFAFSTDKGVIRVDVGNGKITESIKPDTEWQRVVDIYGFANNVYLLDEFKNQIWKYIATDTGFSEKNTYLKEDTKADFAGAKVLQIDGAVWVLKSENKVLKFVQGGADFFAFQKVEPEINNVKAFYTSDDTENAYFLDNENSRVVVTKKNGEYVGQYTGEKFKTADDLIVDEKSKKLYLLEANKIFLVELK